MESPCLDLTFGPMRAPEVVFDPITGEFWLMWKTKSAQIDVQLAGRDELRAMIRSCLEAVEVQHEQTHAESGPRLV